MRMLLLLALLGPTWAADQCSFIPQLGRAGLGWGGGAAETRNGGFKTD